MSNKLIKTLTKVYKLDLTFYVLSGSRLHLNFPLLKPQEIGRWKIMLRLFEVYTKEQI